MINTTLCYIENHGAYLMMHRVKKVNDINKDKWIGVGGKFEEGESPHECARREIYEETGLRDLELHYRGIVTFVSDVSAPELMHLFTATGDTDDLNYDCDEGTLEWVKKERVTDLPIWEGDKIFLGLLSEGCGFFSLKLVYSGDKLVSYTLEK